MSFAYPLALWGLLLVPLAAVALALDGQRRRRVLQHVGHLPQILKMTASVSVARRRAKGVLWVLALALLVVAVARPQRPGAARLLPQRGLDLVVALDFSRSMLAADVYPTRLDRARAELDRLLDELKGDRVGLVAFAGVTLSYPLTTDYAAAKLFWRDLTPADIPVGGTNLGEAIRAGLTLLHDGREHERRPDGHHPAQVMVLLTDGADTEGQARAAAAEAAKQGVRLYTVGMGTREGELVVLKKNTDGTAEYVSDGAGSPVRMQLDDKTLRALAEAAGGEYYTFDAGRSGIEQVQKAIARLERVEEEARLVREPNELCGWFVGAALLLLLIEASLGERRRVGRPQRAAKDGEATEAAGRSTAVSAVVLLALLPLLGGWSWFQRPGPEVAAGNRKLKAGHAEEALADYERALQQRPDDLTVHYNRGAALYALGRYPEAQREFQRAAESTSPSVDPGLRADAYYNTGNALLQQKQAQPAIDAYKHALRLRPDDRRAKWNLELALRQLEQEQQQKQQNDQKQKQDQKQPNQDDQQQSQQDQKQSDQQKPDQQKTNQQNQDQAKQDQQKQDEKNEQQKQDQAKKDQPPPKKNEEGTSPQGQSDSEKPQAAKNEGEKAGRPGDAASENHEKNKDIDRQDAEAVLDAFERVEPTVQKDLARRKAAQRRPPKEDW